MSKKLNGVLGGLIAATLIGSAVPALAVSPGWWGYQNQGYANRREVRDDYARLQQARAKLEYDLRRRASRRVIAQDQAAIQAILDEIERDRHGRYDRYDRYDQDERNERRRVYRRDDDRHRD